MNVEFKKTLSDIDVILAEMDEELTNRVPLEFRKLIHNEKLEGYVPNIDVTVPIEDQELSQQTKDFLALLYLKYWCKDEEEKREIKDTLNRNEANYQKELAEKYNYEKLFEKKENPQKEVAEEIAEPDYEPQNQMVEYKESIVTKIINRLKDIVYNIFRR
jgi:hypothetical protein